jgi:hypothetical protein
MPTDTPFPLAALVEQAKKATPGEWTVWDGPSYVGGGKDLCIGTGETWIVNMDERRCQNYPHHVGCHDEGCKLEGDSDICSVGDDVTAEQAANAAYIASASPSALLDLHAKLAGFRRDLVSTLDFTKGLADPAVAERAYAYASVLQAFDAAVDLGSTEGGKGEAKTP